jgi:hypothetical protein
MYSHNEAPFVLAVPNLALLLRRDGRGFLRLAAAQIAIGLLALPWLFQLPGQVAKVQKAWTLPVPGPAEMIQALVMWHASLPLPLPLLALALFLSLAAVVILALELWRARREVPGKGLWLSLLLAPPALLFAASYIVKPMFIPRAFLISTLAYLAWVGVVIARTWARGAGKVLFAVVALAAVLSLPYHYTYQEHPRSPYRAMTGGVRADLRPGDTIIHETKLSAFPAIFYAPDLPQVFLADPPGSPNDTFEPGSQQAMDLFPQPDLPDAIQSSGPGRVYFVTFSQTFREYAAMGYREHPHIQWLDDHLRRVDRLTFSDLEVYVYERR